MLSLTLAAFAGSSLARTNDTEGLGVLGELLRLPEDRGALAQRARALGTEASRRELLLATRDVPLVFDGPEGRALAIALGASVRADGDGELAVLRLLDALSGRATTTALRPLDGRTLGTIALVLAHTHHPLAERTLLAWAEGPEGSLGGFATAALRAHPPKLRALRSPPPPPASNFDEGFERYLRGSTEERVAFLRELDPERGAPSSDALRRLIAADAVWGARLLAVFASTDPSLHELAREVAESLENAGRLGVETASLLDRARAALQGQPVEVDWPASTSLARLARRATRLAASRNFSPLGSHRIESELRALDGDRKRAFIFGLGASDNARLAPLLLEAIEHEDAIEVRATMIASVRRLLGAGHPRLEDLRNFEPVAGCRSLAEAPESAAPSHFFVTRAFGFESSKGPWELVTAEGRPFRVPVASDGFVASFGVPLRPRSTQ